MCFAVKKVPLPLSHLTVKPDLVRISFEVLPSSWVIGYHTSVTVDRQWHSGCVFSTQPAASCETMVWDFIICSLAASLSMGSFCSWYCQYQGTGNCTFGSFLPNWDICSANEIAHQWCDGLWSCDIILSSFCHTLLKLYAMSTGITIISWYFKLSNVLFF